MKPLKFIFTILFVLSFSLSASGQTPDFSDINIDNPATFASMLRGLVSKNFKTGEKITPKNYVDTIWAIDTAVYYDSLFSEKYKFSFFYNQNALIDSILIYVNNYGMWNILFKQIYEYDEQNRITLKILKKHNILLGQWTDTIRTQTEYFEDSIVQYEYKRWSDNQMHFSYFLAYVYTRPLTYTKIYYIPDSLYYMFVISYYNDLGKIYKDSMAYGTFINGNPVFSFFYYDLYYYTHFNKDSLTLSYSWDASTNDWVPKMKILKHYNQQQLLDTNYRFSFDTTLNSWILNNFNVYLYDSSGHNTENIYYNPDPSSRRLYTYNDPDYDLHYNSETIQIWDTTNNSWTNKYYYVWDFDSIGNNLMFEKYKWVNSNWVPDENYYIDRYYNDVFYLFPFAKRTFSYKKNILLITSLFNQKQKLSVYPNPAKDYLILNTPIYSQYTITDIRGRTVQQGTINSNNTQINISTLKPGIYIIRIGKDKSKFIKL